jgi:hypothetical protein
MPSKTAPKPSRKGKMTLLSKTAPSHEDIQMGQVHWQDDDVRVAYK